MESLSSAPRNTALDKHPKHFTPEEIGPWHTKKPTKIPDLSSTIFFIFLVLQETLGFGGDKLFRWKLRVGCDRSSSDRVIKYSKTIFLSRQRHPGFIRIPSQKRGWHNFDSNGTMRAIFHQNCSQICANHFTSKYKTFNLTAYFAFQGSGGGVFFFAQLLIMSTV